MTVCRSAACHLARRIGQQAELLREHTFAVGDFGRLALERFLESGDRRLFASQRGLALGEVARCGRHQNRRFDSQESRDALALGFELGESYPRGLDSRFERSGFLAQTHRFRLATGTLIGNRFLAFRHFDGGGLRAERPAPRNNAQLQTSRPRRAAACASTAAQASRRRSRVAAAAA